MRAVLLGLVLMSLLLGGCGGGQDKGRPKRQKGPLGPGQVVKRADSLKTATVRGRAYPVGTDRIVLAGPEQSVFAFADSSVVRGVRSPGQQLTVSGPVRRLTEAQAKELDGEVGRLEPDRRPPEVERARRTVGSPYLQVEATPAG